MSRICSSINNLSPYINGNNVFSLQILRWRRKPRWEPVAKSKLVIPDRKKQMENEANELISLHNKFRTQINSVRHFIHQEHQKPKVIFENLLGAPREEQYLDQKCREQNMIWNKNISLIREKRILEENKRKIEFVNNRLKLANIQKELKKSNDSKIVDTQKEYSKYCISQADLYDEIVKALENNQEHSFSIDLKGNVYKDDTAKH